MHRFFAGEAGVEGGRAFLSEEDSGHALRVLRLTVGDEIELVCAPWRYRAKIAQVQEGRVQVEIVEPLRTSEARTRVTLYQGLPKGDKMEMIVQKCTELGVHAVRPVAMERCVTRLEGKDAAKRIDRWQKIAREAVKQCARVDVPEVREPRRIAQLASEFSDLDVLIVPWEEARDGDIRQALAPFEERKDLRVGILIGPEGGIGANEAAWLAERADAKLVTLGPRILRTETAALAALTMVMAYRGEMA